MKPVTKRNRKGIRIRKKVLVRAALISTIVFGSTFALAFLFSRYTNNITARIIDKIIERRSEGVYHIHYENISYNFFDQVLTINNLDFSQDTLSTSKQLLFFKNEDNAFEASIPFLYLDVKNIWSVYFDRELLITGISMYEPNIIIKSYKENKGVEWQQDAGSLYDLISDHLRVFEIDKLVVENGQFTFMKEVTPKRQYRINNISFSIKNFLLDKDADQNKEKFFYTDDIDVELLNQTFRLKDSIHTLSFKKLLFSTTQSEIEIDSLVISERQHDQKSFKNSDIVNAYIPKINIQHIDFTSAYNEGLLRIGNVHINFPKINISDKPKPEKAKGEKNTRISRLALDYFNNIQVDSFNLKNADLGYVFKTAHRSQGFTLDSFNVRLTNFVLDSSNIRSDQRPIYYDDLEFVIKDYQFNLPDSIHILTFSGAVGSTKNRLIKFEELRIDPRKDVNVAQLLRKNEKNKTYNIYLPSAELRRVGHNFMNSDTLFVDELILNTPKIKVIEYPNIKLDSVNKDINLKDPYPFITDFLDAAYLNNLKLKNGRFSLHRDENQLAPVTLIEDFNLDLSNIRIDSNTSTLNKYLAAEEMELSTGKFIIEDPKSHLFANTELLYYSSRNKTARLFDAEMVLDTFYYDTLVHSQKIKAFKANLSGLDINQLDQNSKKFFRRLYLENPKADLHLKAELPTSDSKETPNPFTLFSINKIKIENGDLKLSFDGNQTFTGKKLFLDAENFSRDTSLFKKYSLDTYTFSAADLGIIDRSENLEYHSKRISYDYAKELLSIHDIHINSGKFKKQFDHYEIDVPTCKITNWRPLDLYFKDRLLSGKITIDKPKLDIVQGYDPDSEYIPPSKLLAEFAQKIRAEEIVINDGKIHLDKHTKTDSLFFSSEDFDITISRFDFDELKQNINFLFAEDISTSFSDNKIVFRTSKDEIRIDGIHNSTFAGSLWFDGIRFIAGADEKYDFSDLIIDKLYFKNINYEQLKEKKLIVDDILIFQPSVEISPSFKLKDGKRSNVKKWLFLDNIELDTSLLKLVKAGAIEIKSGKINFNLPDSIYNETLPINNLELQMRDFLIDEKKSTNVFRSRYADLSFDGFTYHLPDSLNKISTDKIILSFTDSALTLKNVHYFPKVEKYEYGEIVGKQTDYIDIKSSEVSLSGIDFFKLFSDKGIDASKLSLEELNIYAFRDKRIPRKNEPIKPLPQDLLRKIPYELNIDSAQIIKSNIIYEELDPKALTPGRVDFSDLNANMLNITNSNKTIDKQQFMHLKASAILMDGGTLEAIFRFDLMSDDDEFFIGAKLDKMDLTNFNRILEPNAFVKVRKGENESLDMQAQGDESVAVGTMIFEYDDLKISLINKNTYESKGMGPVLGSFFANTFIIKKSNPSLLVTREGNIYFERNPYRSMFNYWAKIFFSGIVSSIGAKSNKKEIKKYEKMEDKLSDDE